MSEETELAVRARNLETRLATLAIEKKEAVAVAAHEREVSDQKAKELAEQQKFVLQRRWDVQSEEIQRELDLEKSNIHKQAAVTETMALQEAAEIHRKLAREIEERESEIKLINKEREREAADIQRFSAREAEERDREIAHAGKTRELEQIELERLKVTQELEKAQYVLTAVGPISEAEKQKEIERISEQSEADVARLHTVSQAEARKEAAEHEAKAVITRARSTSEAQKISAEGIEREAAARGRAESEVEALRIENSQRRLHAEASGMEAKAEALKKYNDAAMFLELAKLRIEAERDVHIDQAKAMGHALSEAQIRMYGSSDGTMDTIRGMFTSGFALGEVLEGFAQSVPDGLRERFAKNGVRGIFGRPYKTGEFKEMADQLADLVRRTFRTKKAREIPFSDALKKLEGKAGSNEKQSKAIAMLRDANEAGVFDDVQFDLVWSLLQATAKAADG